MAVKALLFDLDGTICDTDSLHLANWLEVLRPHGIDVDMELYNEKLSGRPVEEVVDELVPHLSPEERQELLELEEDGYRGRVDQVGTICGLRRFLKDARERGLKLALVSNARKEDARNSLESLELGDVFEPMVFAEEVGVEKPDPAPYRAALKELGVSPEESLAFEDSPSGARGAVEAGIPVVGLSSTHGPDALREAGAEFVVGDFADRALYERLDNS